MIRVFIITLLSVFFISCSSEPLPYAWQAQAKLHLDKYQEMMLKGDFFQAKYYLQDAITEAKNDVTLETLAIVYLTQCAMEKVMNQKSACTEYKNIKKLVNKPHFDAYADMLLNQAVTHINLLGKYRSLYNSIKIKEVTLADIKSFDTIYAQAIASMLVYNSGLINETISSYMIDKASLENMKGLMLVWLNNAQTFMSGEKLERVKNQIKILSD